MELCKHKHQAAFECDRAVLLPNISGGGAGLGCCEVQWFPPHEWQAVASALCPVQAQITPCIPSCNRFIQSEYLAFSRVPLTSCRASNYFHSGSPRYIKRIL